MRRFWIVLVLLLLLVACGGNTATESPADSGNTNTENAAANDSGEEVADTAADEDAAAEETGTGGGEEAADEETADDDAAADEAAADEAAADEATVDEAAAAEAAGDEGATEETDAEEAGDEEAVDDAAGADIPMSGTDPETGLEINPNPIPKGVEFIAIGEVMQMNLTPQTSPEFVIRGPNGVTYRIATQGLSEIFTLDGDSLLPHEYKINMIARATAFLAPDASLSDVLTSADFTIVVLPE